MKRLIRLAQIAIVLAGMATVASAGVINIEPVPDLNAIFLTVTYDGTDLLVEGFTASLTADVGGTPQIYPISSDSPLPTFSLIAQVSPLGVASSGHLTINGCVDDHPDAPGCPGSGLLLESASLVEFGFEPFSGGEIYFGFDSLSGALEPLWGPRRAYVKLNTSFAFDTFPGDFSAPFTLSASLDNVADVGAVPEPGTWFFLASGLGSIWLGKRRSRAS
jgi:hypothetical protein